MRIDRAASGAISGPFASASADRSSTPAVSPKKATEIAIWADRTTARAEREFRENHAQWTIRKYGDLLARDGARLSLQPPGATDDRKAHLMRAADQMVKRNHAARLASINRIAERLLTGRDPNLKRDERGR